EPPSIVSRESPPLLQITSNYVRPTPHNHLLAPIRLDSIDIESSPTVVPLHPSPWVILDTKTFVQVHIPKRGQVTIRIEHHGRCITRSQDTARLEHTAHLLQSCNGYIWWG